MTIPHVPSNPERIARAAEQNALIDQCNATTSSAEGHASTLATHDQRLTSLEQAITPPVCVLRKNVAQGVASAVDTTLTWQVTQTDTAAMHSGDTIVIPQDRTYLITAVANLEKGGVSGAECNLYIASGSGFIADTAIGGFGQHGVGGNDPGGFGNGLATSLVRACTTGEVLSVVVYQASTVTRNARATAFGGCSFAVAALD